MENSFLLENKIVYCDLVNMSMFGRIVGYALSLPYNSRLQWFSQNFGTSKLMLKFAVKQNMPIFSQNEYGNAMIFYPRAFASSFVFPKTIGIMHLGGCSDLYKKNQNSIEVYEMSIFMGDDDILQSKIVAMTQQGVNFLSL